jgi:signal transduction histidine kinase
VIAVSLATIVGNAGLEPRLNEAARLRLQASARHAADVAAGLYAQDGRLSAQSQQTLAHAAAMGGVRLAVRTGNGLLAIGPPPAGVTATAPFVVNGQRVGTVVVSSAGGSLLTPDEQHLRHSLDRLHLIAGAAAVLAAVVIAVLLAETLSRPLRRIRTVAERLEQGDLEARVPESGDNEVRAVGRAMNRLAETLEHEEDIRKTSVADLSHELRTPVNGLLTRIEAAQDGVLPPEENLEAMQADALRLTRLLDDLATLADAEQPGLLVDKQPLDLADVAGGVAHSFEPSFADAGIELQLDLSTAFVDGDRGRLEQVVTNLLSNALRYTEEGSVKVRVGRQDDAAFLEVADTGVGIAPDELRHLFTRFWRSDRSRSRQTGGSGIGLSVVRELVRAHDGRVDVDSTLGSGSRFRVVLPSSTMAPAVDASR